MAGIKTLKEQRHQLSDLIHHLADNLEEETSGTRAREAAREVAESASKSAEITGILEREGVFAEEDAGT